MAKTTATKEFANQRRALSRAGKTKQLEKIALAWMNSQDDLPIGLKPTDYGESRADVEKWEIGSRYRLITQVVSTEPLHRVFLFAGSHAEVDRWLDRPGKRKWVARSTDNTVHVIEVSDEIHTPQLPLAADDVERKLLLGLTADQWETLGLSADGRVAAEAITSSDVEMGCLDDLVQECTEDIEVAICLLDITKMMYEGNANSVAARIELLSGDAVEVPAEQLSKRLSDIKSTEELITFEDPEDLRQLLNRDQWEDWHLFLHPKQRDLVERSYSGPARIRGISGSGKTCIVVHRARRLAERYRRPVLNLTLTGSAKSLLHTLKDALCGKGSVSGKRIRTATMAGAAGAFLREFDHRWISGFINERGAIVYSDRRKVRDALETTIHDLNLLGALGDEPALVSSMGRRSLLDYAVEEIQYLRTAFTLEERDSYQTAKRAGRKLALGQRGRRAVLEAASHFEEVLSNRKLIDHEQVILRSLSAVATRIDWKQLMAMGEYPYPLSRCVIVDEAQDMTENELRLISFFSPPAPDSLFIVGDGAQKVFNRGFTFSRAGIDVKGRSSILRKNYRNTRQILKAAYPLVTSFVNETSEENSRYLEGNPDYSTREGLQPEILQFKSAADEARWVASKARWHVKERGLRPSDICIVSAAQHVRVAVQNSLRAVQLDAAGLMRSPSLPQAVPGEQVESVRISTIESVKGHEFPVVFVVGLTEGILPTRENIDKGDLWLDAARLYVAMTRARDRLYLSSARETDYGLCDPSRLIETIKESCQEGEHHAAI